MSPVHNMQEPYVPRDHKVASRRWRSPLLPRATTTVHAFTSSSLRCHAKSLRRATVTSLQHGFLSHAPYISLEPFPCLPTATPSTPANHHVCMPCPSLSQQSQLSPITSRPVYSSSIAGCLEPAPMHSSLQVGPSSCTMLSSLPFAAR